MCSITDSSPKNCPRHKITRLIFSLSASSRIARLVYPDVLIFILSPLLILSIWLEGPPWKFDAFRKRDMVFLTSFGLLEVFFCLRFVKTVMTDALLCSCSRQSWPVGDNGSPPSAFSPCAQPSALGPASIINLALFLASKFVAFID